jgi:hypothetical protein
MCVKNSICSTTANTTKTVSYYCTGRRVASPKHNVTYNLVYYFLNSNLFMDIPVGATCLCGYRIQVMGRRVSDILPVTKVITYSPPNPSPPSPPSSKRRGHRGRLGQRYPHPHLQFIFYPNSYFLHLRH